MIIRVSASLAILLASCGLLVAAEPTDNQPPAGFTALFNGHDLSGWQGLVGTPVTRPKMSAEDRATAQAAADEALRQHWTVEDGVLVYDGKREKGKSFSLCTQQDYGNFELLVDWKIEPGGDSGIYLRGTPQVQIWDTKDETSFDAGADKGSGALWNNKQHERFPLVLADKPAGQWNHFRIRMVGDKVSVWLNDQQVVDNVVLENYWDREQPLPTSGPIELQDHGSKLYFKNVYLRELPDAEAAK